MPRPRKCRWVQDEPAATLYRPAGMRRCEIAAVTLAVEGLEALRLADAEGLDHESAAARMGVSRPTFSRVLNEARRCVASALAQGLAIRIGGGDFAIGQACCGRRHRRHGCHAPETED